MLAPSDLERHLAAARVARADRGFVTPAGPSWMTRLLRRRPSVAPARGAAAEAPIVLRPARGDDAPAIARLAELEGRSLPGDDRIVAEAGGRVVAAADVATGVAIADPFTPTAATVALLRLRAAQLRPQGAAR